MFQSCDFWVTQFCACIFFTRNIVGWAIAKPVNRWRKSPLSVCLFVNTITYERDEMQQGWKQRKMSWFKAGYTWYFFTFLFASPSPQTVPCTWGLFFSSYYVIPLGVMYVKCAVNSCTDPGQTWAKSVFTLNPPKSCPAEMCHVLLSCSWWLDIFMAYSIPRRMSIQSKCRKRNVKILIHGPKISRKGVQNCKCSQPRTTIFRAVSTPWLCCHLRGHVSSGVSGREGLRNTRTWEARPLASTRRPCFANVYSPSCPRYKHVML